jgi:hypothetical protein
MVDWFETLKAKRELPADAAFELQHRGFIVLPGPVPAASRHSGAPRATLSKAARPNPRVQRTRHSLGRPMAIGTLT